MSSLHELAHACGLVCDWRDVAGREHRVPDHTLAAILQALGHEAGSPHQIARSLAAIEAREAVLPAMLVADAGVPVRLPVPARSAEILENGRSARRLAVTDGHLAPVTGPGYYDLLVDGQQTRLAVAPPHCPLPRDTGRRHWGVSLQIPSLRGGQDRAFGTFGELAQAVEILARNGADAVAINPVHALFPGTGAGFSPYSPSSRLFLNGAMGDPALAGLPPLPPGDAPPLIDWEQALPRRMQELRGVFDGLEPGQRAQIDSACADADRAMNGALFQHALFDALDCHFRPAGARGWRDWPPGYRTPDTPQVRRFTADHREEIAFHQFLQWLARRGLEEVGKAAERAGMAIGLIADLAVGVDPSGSDAWQLRAAMLDGLTIGAPPDPLGPLGQNWSITGFSPEGLAATGYAPWIAMVRSALTYCGGLRIDHAFGLERLWVIPAGGGAGDGAYLRYPFADLVRLATLEAHLAGALIIAEDLGTAPPGFTEVVSEHRMLGMRVLWFERAEDHGFIGAQDYPAQSVAMTGTHDTVTVAGWWRGRDLDWAEQLGRLPSGIDRAQAEAIREWDRGLLWSTIGGGAPRPAPDDPQPVVDAAIRHIIRTPSRLAIVPLEDLLGLDEQPNLPGTIHEHPNWRRRLDLPLADLLKHVQSA